MVSEDYTPTISNTELPSDDGLTIAKVIENPQMFILPNNPRVTDERLQLTVNALVKQYTIARQLKDTRTKTLSEINSLPQAKTKDDSWIRNTEDISEQAPQEAAPGLMRNLEYLPKESREHLVQLALKKAPQEAAPGLMRNLEYLPEKIREEIESQCIEILRTTERELLTKSEEINPILYGEIEALEEQFSRREFPKTGTRTVLLGGSLKNQAILRIIPIQAFVSWMKAYIAVKDWQDAGFKYVPIEPILKANLCKDGENARVYAGVLGISVGDYLRMYSNRAYHHNVEEQVNAIIKTLKKIGIRHGDEHNDNFCVLHNRTPEGEIDWSTPPRVYCIDFDESISN